MNIYIDCEFNDFKGELISMALVADDGSVFYEILPCASPSEWVAKNVMPILNKEPVDFTVFQLRLMTHLSRFDSINVVADWTEDVKHFCDSLITGPGERLPIIDFTVSVVFVDADSSLPHNALSDAIGLKNHLMREG